MQGARQPASVLTPSQNADHDYKYLESFCHFLETKNPGTQAKVSAHEDGSFQRMAWGLHAQAVRCDRSGKRVFSFDAAHFKPNSRHRGVALNASGFDCNGQPVTFGAGVSDTENAEEYLHFFNLLRDVQLDADDAGTSRTLADILDTAETVIFSDRDKGLANAVKEAFPSSIHLPCCFHLLKNLLRKDPSFPSETFWLIQSSWTENLMRERLDECRSRHVDGVKYLENVEQPWCVWQYMSIPGIGDGDSPRKAKTWGLRTSNLSEIANSVILNIRELPPYAFASVSVRMASIQLWQAANTAAQLCSNNQELTPYALRLCAEIKQRAALFVAQPESNSEAVVDLIGRGTQSRPHSTSATRVTVPVLDESDPEHPHVCEAGSCSCHSPFLLGLYCRHAYTAEWYHMTPSIPVCQALACT